MSEENLQLPNQVIQLPLKEGEVYKNYKELCAKLSEKERTGRARQNQISYWQMYFEFSKKGHSYHIEKIIESNYKPWLGSRSSSQVKPQSEMIQKLLLSLIYDYSKENQFITDVNDIILSNKLIAEMLAMVNKSYYHYYHKTSELAEDLGLSIELAQDFYMRYTSLFTNDIRTALKQLENRKLIYVETVTVFREYVTPELTGYEKELLSLQDQEIVLKEKQERWKREINDINKDNYFRYGDYRIADSDTLKQIIEIEYAVLKSMGINNIKNVIALKRYTEYQSKVVRKLRSFYGIAYYFKAYKIVFSPNLLKFITKTNGEVIKLKTSEEIALKTTLNKVMGENIKSNYQKHRENLEEFLSKGDYFGEYYPMLPTAQKLAHDNSLADVDALLQRIVFI